MKFKHIDFLAVIAVLIFSSNILVKSTGPFKELQQCTDSLPKADCNLTLKSLMSCNGQPINESNKLYKNFGFGIANCFEFFHFDLNEKLNSAKVSLTNRGTNITNTFTVIVDCGHVTLTDSNGTYFMEFRLLPFIRKDGKVCVTAAVACTNGCISYAAIVSNELSGNFAKSSLNSLNENLQNYARCPVKGEATSSPRSAAIAENEDLQKPCES